MNTKSIVTKISFVISIALFFVTTKNYHYQDQLSKTTKFRKFNNNKLCRDKIIARMEQFGSIVHWKKLDDVEFLEQLKIKLVEEVHEVCNAKTQEALLEELADVLEVVASLCDVHKFTLEDIINVQNRKRDERGGYNEQKFITIAEHPINSYFEKYCLADPEKYPEIID